MKRRHRNRKMCQELKLINQNLNAIIQNQNELYCKLDQLYAIAKYFGDLDVALQINYKIFANKLQNLFLISLPIIV